jgi:TPR repeat protein
MKAKRNCQRVAILLCVLCVLARPNSALAQYGLTDNQRAGAQVNGFPSSSFSRGPTAAEIQQERIQQRIQLAGGHPLRVVDGKIYNIVDNPLWKIVEAEVYEKDGGIIILLCNSYVGSRNSFYVALTNYSGQAVAEQKITVIALKTGIYNMADVRPIELYDLGKPYVPTSEEIAAAKAAQEKAKADAKAKAAEQKKTAEARALQYNQDAAAKGDSFGLMRMGERYRDGDGVEKDVAKAKEYLQKAADAGSPTAKEELSQLQQ